MHSRRQRPFRVMIPLLLLLSFMFYGAAVQAGQPQVISPPNNSASCGMATKLYNSARYRWEQDKKSKKADSYQSYQEASSNFESNCGMTPAEAAKQG